MIRVVAILTMLWLLFGCNKEPAYTVEPTESDRDVERTFKRLDPEGKFTPCEFGESGKLPQCEIFREQFRTVSVILIAIKESFRPGNTCVETITIQGKSRQVSYPGPCTTPP